MFLVDGSDSVRVKITAGPEITKFDESLVGSKVRVYGTLIEERIDEKYLNEWENEVKIQKKIMRPEFTRERKDTKRRPHRINLRTLLHCAPI